MLGHPARRSDEAARVADEHGDVDGPHPARVDPQLDLDPGQPDQPLGEVRNRDRLA